MITILAAEESFLLDALIVIVKIILIVVIEILASVDIVEDEESENIYDVVDKATYGRIIVYAFFMLVAESILLTYTLGVRGDIAFQYFILTMQATGGLFWIINSVDLTLSLWIAILVAFVAIIYLLFPRKSKYQRSIDFGSLILFLRFLLLPV